MLSMASMDTIVNALTTSINMIGIIALTIVSAKEIMIQEIATPGGVVHTASTRMGTQKV